MFMYQFCRKSALSTKNEKMGIKIFFSSYMSLIFLTVGLTRYLLVKFVYIVPPPCSVGDKRDKDDEKIKYAISTFYSRGIQSPKWPSLLDYWSGITRKLFYGGKTLCRLSVQQRAAHLLHFIANLLNEIFQVEQTSNVRGRLGLAFSPRFVP